MHSAHAVGRVAEAASVVTNFMANVRSHGVACRKYSDLTMTFCAPKRPRPRALSTNFVSGDFFPNSVNLYFAFVSHSSGLLICMPAWAVVETQDRLTWPLGQAFQQSAPVAAGLEFSGRSIDRPSGLWALDQLTPGDFAVVAKRSKLLGISQPDALLGELRREQAAKPNTKNPIGFRAAS